MSARIYITVTIIIAREYKLRQRLKSFLYNLLTKQRTNSKEKNNINNDSITFKHRKSAK